MKNQEKLVKITRADVRKSLMLNGAWSGVVKYYDERRQRSLLVYATYTSLAQIVFDINLLEFYTLS